VILIQEQLSKNRMIVELDRTGRFSPQRFTSDRIGTAVKFKNFSITLYSLFFIMGPCYVNMLKLLMVIAGYTIYEHVITQQLITDMESPICTRSSSSRN
jgi:hypothetical protein